MKLSLKQIQFLKKLIPSAAFLGGLCCFTPVVLVLLGISTVSYAASLSDILYGTYKWAFRGGAVLFLLLGLAWYFYKHEKVCSIDAVKKKRTLIINLIIISLIVLVFAYIIWLYVIVEVVGYLLGIWG